MYEIRWIQTLSNFARGDDNLSADAVSALKIIDELKKKHILRVDKIGEANNGAIYRYEFDVKKFQDVSFRDEE